MAYTHIARFKGVKGRWAVEWEIEPPTAGMSSWDDRGSLGGSLGGQRIIGAPGTAAFLRQVSRYGNRPDTGTGLMLNEMYRTFSGSEIVSIKPLVPVGVAECRMEGGCQL